MIRKTALALAVCGLLTRSACAFLCDLSSEQVREAYFLGRDPERRSDFFAKYIHRLPVSEKGPNVELIEFRTPYEQVALRAQERWFNYSVQDAEQDWAAQPGRVVVRVLIWATPTFAFAKPPTSPTVGESKPWRPEDSLRGFTFQVSQASAIKLKKLTARSACPPGCGDFDGFEVFLNFDAEEFAPETVKVQITTPDEQVFQTTFDLDRLK